MFVALPVVSGDAHLAIKNLDWAIELDGPVPFDCLVAHEIPDADAISPVIDRAKKYFRNVIVHRYNPWLGTKAWPQPQNYAWQNVGKWMYSNMLDHFLWWEPDAVPVRKGWLTLLANAVIEGKKPFCGCWFYSHGRYYMAGVGIYTPKVLEICPRAFTTLVNPFDQILGMSIVNKVHQTTLIRHEIEPVSFRDGNDLKFHLDQETALFHKCKDGSLIDVLRRFPEYTRVERRPKTIPVNIKHQSVDFIKRIKDLFYAPRRQCDYETAYIQLGRYGDIVNILPILRIKSRWDSIKPVLYVHKDHANLLEGVDYVKTEIWNGDGNDRKGVEIAAKKKYKTVFNLQQHGTGYAPEHHTPSYNIEEWNAAGMLDFWGTLPLEVNARNYAREAKTFEIPAGKPVLVLSLKGQSSPFKEAAKLRTEIETHWGQAFTVIDISDQKFHRVFDMMGLFDRADILITADTVSLHLVQGCSTPFVALLSDTSDWHRTRTLREALLRFPYAQLTDNLKDLHAAIDHVLSNWKVPMGQFIHATERHSGINGSEFTRRERVFDSWERIYNTGAMIPAHYWRYSRDSRLVGERKALPFLKDVLKNAMQVARKDDLIVFTNDDIYLHPEVLNQIRTRLRYVGALSSTRVDIRPDYMETAMKETQWPVNTPNAAHWGRDLFAFRKGWLEKHLPFIPDFILGASDWDTCLACLLRLEHGFKSTLHNLDKPFPTCELPKGYVLHETHDAEWCRPENVQSRPMQIHNRLLFKGWLEKHLPDLRFHWLAGL